MRIDFEDGSYVEARKSDEAGKILIIISAKDHINQSKKIVNSAEMTADEFKKMISDVSK